MNGGWSKLPQLLPGGNYKTKIVFGGRGGENHLRLQHRSG